MHGRYQLSSWNFLPRRVLGTVHPKRSFLGSARAQVGRLLPSRSQGTRASWPRVLDERQREAPLSEASIIAGLQLLDQSDVEIVRYLQNIGAAEVVFRDPSLAADLQRNPLVDYIEPATFGALLATNAGEMAHGLLPSTSPVLAQQTPWGISRVGAPQVWSRYSGSGIKAQLIDAGYDPYHPDLPTIPSSNCGGKYNGCIEGAAGHATHVAGILAARNNSSGVVGVAPGISANDLYVWGSCSPTQGICDMLDVAAGLDQAITWGVDVVNMSLGGPQDETSVAVSNALDQAYAAGIVLVASAGNHFDGSCPWCGEPSYWSFPGSHWRTIAVSGINSDDAFAHPGSTAHCKSENALYGDIFGSSNYGPYVTVSAPFDAYSSAQGSYEVKCGTSMAAPHVTGAVALLLDRAPSMTPAQVKDRMTGTASDRGTAGFDDFFGHGVLSVLGLVGPFASIAGPTTVEGGSSCTWTAGVVGGYGSMSFNWYRNGQLVSTSNTYTTNTGWTDFSLELRVTDAQSIQDNTAVFIDVYNAGSVRRCTH